MSAQPGGQLQKLWRTRKGFAAGLLLFLLVLAGFMPALSNDFVGYDDPEYVTANPHVQQGLTWETLRWAFSNTEVAAWHPLVWLSHALDYECFGLRPWGHHLTAILLHGVNAVLCFVVLRRLTGAFARSWAAAALFALHPLRVESVAWVSERKDVLSMVFFLLMLWSYARYVQTRNSKERLEIQRTKKPAAGSSKAPAPIRHGLPWFFFGFSLFSFALGLMSKPMLVTGPVVLLLLDLWPLGRFQREPVRKLLVEKFPFFLAALLVSMVTMLAQPRGTVTLESASLIARSENAVVSYCRYLGKIFWPVDLAPFYPPVVHWPATAWVSAGIVLAAISFLAVRLWRSRPYLLVGWLWFLVALLPVIGLVQIGEQSVTDRYTYLPGIGILLMLVWVISESNWQYRTVGVGALLGCVLMGCLGLTWAQVHYWQNSETLFRHTLEVTKRNYLAHNNLGVVFAQQGHWTEAIEQYQEALQIKPAYPEALKNLGAALDNQGKLDQAIECFQAALRQRPDFPAASTGLGLVYSKQGRFDEAEQLFHAAIRSKPDYADAHFNLALELERKGRLNEAAVEFNKTLELQPNSADVHNNLGVLLEKAGKLDEAIQSYQEAIRINPGFARAHYNLGVALAEKGMIGKAIGAFEAALRFKPDYPAAQTNLAILRSLNRQRPGNQ